MNGVLGEADRAELERQAARLALPDCAKCSECQLAGPKKVLHFY